MAIQNWPPYMSRDPRHSPNVRWHLFPVTHDLFGLLLWWKAWLSKESWAEDSFAGGWAKSSLFQSSFPFAFAVTTVAGFALGGRKLSSSHGLLLVLLPPCMACSVSIWLCCGERLSFLCDIGLSLCHCLYIPLLCSPFLWLYVFLLCCKGGRAGSQGEVGQLIFQMTLMVSFCCCSCGRYGSVGEVEPRTSHLHSCFVALGNSWFRGSLAKDLSFYFPLEKVELSLSQRNLFAFELLQRFVAKVDRSLSLIASF